MAKGKYDLLAKHLRALSAGQARVTLSFQTIEEEILGSRLPDSAYNPSYSWWGNDRTKSHARAWLDAGWRVSHKDLVKKTVTFQRSNRAPSESQGSAGAKQMLVSSSSGSERNMPEEYTPGNTVIVVSCTGKKVWKTNHLPPSYVPAGCAYTGRNFQCWQEARDKCEKLNSFSWVVLSAKYGFIEPEHPIGNYDVTFPKPYPKTETSADTGAMSPESLRRQVAHQGRNIGGKQFLMEFDNVVVLGGQVYADAVRGAFGKEPVDFKRFYRRICSQHSNLTTCGVPNRFIRGQ